MEDKDTEPLERKEPKWNPWWRILIWGLFTLNTGMFIWNVADGSWAWIAGIFAIPCSIYLLHNHHVKGFDPWNSHRR